MANMNHEGEQKFEKKNIRPTSMRKLIYRILSEKDQAMSLYEIEQQFDQVERSTIFRTLRVFQDNCLIHLIYDGTGAVKYALCDDDCSCGINDLHIHFLCSSCGNNYCLKELPVPYMDLPEGYTFENANFVIRGICPDCQ
ncbi:MAG: transcriptional repressor [Bacteroidales bacterium]|nr:transcriptional repressor [Bacteroidales bacterium]MCF8327157.1 transcriptional repressor [Bacteroidales bacterium]